MAVDIATLGLAIDSREVVKARVELDNLAAAGGRTEQAFVSFERSVQSQIQGVVDLQKAVNLTIAALGGWTVARHIAETTQLAARLEQLDAIMKAVGNSSGYTDQQMRTAADGIRSMGITMQEARETATKMAQSQLDLGKATQLARVAQDAAVIGNTNSSEALGRLINGIRSAEVETLRTIGINVSFEQSYDKLAAQLGKSASALSENEKAIARQNAVLEAGKNIAGAYAGSMDTAGKMLSSTTRLVNDISTNIGKAFLPTYTDGVRLYYGALKAVNDNLDHMATDGSLEAIGKSVQTVARVAGEAAIALGAVGAARFLGPLVQQATEAAVAQARLTVAVASGNAVMIEGTQATAAKAVAEREAAAATMAGAEAERARVVALVASIEAEIRLANVQLAAQINDRGRALMTQELAAKSLELAAARQVLAAAETTVTAAQTRAAAAMVAETTAMDALTMRAQLAAGAMKAWQGVLAFFGGPVGLGITALGAAFYLLATRESEAEKISRQHADALKAVKDGADAAVLGIDKVTDAMVRQQRARAQMGTNAAESAMAGVRAELGGAGMFGWSGDAAKFGRDVASQVLELKQALNAGRVDVEGFGTAMAEIAARHPDFAGQAKEVADLVTKYREAADAARTLAGQMAQLQGVDDTTVAAFARGRLAVQAFTDQQTNLTKAAGFAMKDGKLIAQPLAEIAGYEATLADINKALAGSFTVNGQAVKFTTDQLAELARVSPLVEQALQRLREKSDPVAQAVKNLGQEAASMAVPAGVERERVKARQGVENALGMPAADTSAIDSAVSAVALARLRDTTRETGQAAAGQRLLAAAAGGNALAQAEAARTVELYNEALRTYGATVAAAVLAGKPLPNDLAALGRALEQVDLAKFAAEAARVGKEAQLEAEASGRLAEAWRTGSIAAIEAAGRENELAKLLERVPGHAKAAADSIDLLRAARRNLAAGQFLGQLQAEIDALERLGQARRLGEAAAREAQAKEDANRVIRDPSAPIVDPAVAAAMQAQAVAKANATAAWEAENRVLQTLHGSRQQAAEDLEAVTRLYQAGAISADEFATANNQAMMRALQDNRDFASGAELAIRRYVDSASNSAAQMDTFFTNSFRSMEDAVVNWAKTGKASATELFDTIIAGIIRIAAQKAVLGPMESLVGGLIGGIAKSIGASFGGDGGSSGGSGTTVPVPDTGNYAVVHVGGIAGHGTGITRDVDSAIFAGAPRFHSGKDPWLMPGEVPAILKDDEEVLTRQDPRHRWNGNAANSNGGGGRTVVNVTAPPGTTQDQVQQKRSTGSSGEEIIDIIIGEKVDKMTREGRFDPAFRDTFGVTRRGIRRT